MRKVRLTTYDASKIIRCYAITNKSSPETSIQTLHSVQKYIKHLLRCLWVSVYARCRNRQLSHTSCLDYRGPDVLFLHINILLEFLIYICFVINNLTFWGYTVCCCAALSSIRLYVTCAEPQTDFWEVEDPAYELTFCLLITVRVQNFWSYWIYWTFCKFDEKNN